MLSDDRVDFSSLEAESSYSDTHFLIIILRTHKRR